MRLIAYIKLTFKQMIKNIGLYFFIFAVFPLLVSTLLGYFQRDLFKPPVELPKFQVNVVDKDNSAYSRKLIEFLKSDEVKNVISLVDNKKDYNLQMTVPKGYEDSLINSRKNIIPIKISDKEFKGSPAEFSGLIDRYNGEISQQILIEKNLRMKNLSSDKNEGILEKVNGVISRAYSSNSIHDNIIKLKKSLSSYEYYSVTFSGFVLIMLAMSLSAGVFLEKEIGLFRRILSTSISRQKYFNFSLVSSFICAVLIIGAYVFAYRILGLSFRGSIVILLVMILVQGLLATSVTGVLVAFFNKKTSAVFMNIILMFQALIGGTFFPTDKMSNNSILKILSNYSPDILISKAYKSYLIYNSFGEIGIYLLGMIIVSILLYIISLAKVSIKWGE